MLSGMFTLVFSGVYSLISHIQPHRYRDYPELPKRMRLRLTISAFADHVKGEVTYSLQSYPSTGVNSGALIQHFTHAHTVRQHQLKGAQITISRSKTRSCAKFRT